MSQRASGYARKERDLYETPEWVTEALLPYLKRRPLRVVWEPACGSGKMAGVLEQAAPIVYATDIETGHDFLNGAHVPECCDAVITNPPYNKAREFIERALEIMEPRGGRVAMLLRTDYDHARTRRHLFADDIYFAGKLVLTKRIVWFEGGKSPSFNHAWFLWDCQNDGIPRLWYGP